MGERGVVACHAARCKITVIYIKTDEGALGHPHLVYSVPVSVTNILLDFFTIVKRSSLAKVCRCHRM